MLDGYKIRNWAYLLLRGQETIAEHKRVKGTLRRAGAYLLLRGQETIAERKRVKGTLRRAGKKEVNAITGVENLNFNNSIVLETKLSSSTALTTPQTNALAKVKTTSNTFGIRTISKESKTNSEYVLGSATDYKNLKITDYIKVNSDGVGNTIQDVISLK